MTDEAAEAAAAEADEESTEAAENDEESTESNDDAEEPADPEDQNTVDDDDFVRIAYTARSVESDQLVDTTDEAVAEEEGVDVENRSFGPRVIALGAGHLFPSVESAIIGGEVGDSGSVEVPPSEAFGEYDPENVRTVSADTIPEDDRYPGAQVEIDGQHGFVETIIGGRARVDFNHPIAGEPIEYNYEIREIVTDRIERAKGLLSAVVDVDLDLDIKTDVEEQEVEPDDEEDDPETEEVDVETLYIESVPQLAMNQQWLFRKRQIAQDIIDRIGVDRVIVQEIIEGSDVAIPGMGDLEAQIDDVDVDPDEIVEELDEELEE